MAIRPHLRGSRVAFLLAAALLLLAVEQATAVKPAPPPPAPLDAYGDDLFQLSTSLAPNVILIMDNSESMSHIEWHPAFDQAVISPTCNAFVDGTNYLASDLAWGYGFPNADHWSQTECGNTRTLRDPAHLDAMSDGVLWGGAT